MPLIAHLVYPNGYAHYVVIYKIKNNKLTIMDPAKGKVIIDEEEFKKIWSNVVIIFHPKNKIVNFSNNVSIFSIFLNYIYLFKNKYIFYIFINIILMILTLIHSFFLSWSIEHLNNYDLLLKIIVLTIIVIFLKNIINYIKSKISSALNYMIDSSLYNDFTKRLFKLPSHFFINRTNGEVMSRFNELGNIKSLLTNIFVTLCLDSILVISSLILLGFVDLKITLLLLLISGLYCLVFILFSKSIYNNVRDVIEKDSVYNNCLLENINLFNSIQNLGISDNVILKTSLRLDELCQSNLKFEKNFNKNEFINNLLNDLIILIIMSMCIFNIFYGGFDISLMILYISLVSIYFDSLKNILDIIPKFSFFKVSFEKLNDFYNIDIEDNSNFNREYKNGDIEFKNVSLSYDNYNKVLKNINLKIKNKTHTLLIGESGVGKSTLLRCLVSKNFYQGKIFISDVNIKDYSLDTLRNNILYVSQNEKIFNDNIYNNITCYKNVSISHFYSICRICLVDKIVENKPFRYMSHVDNELSNLSGGERQRIILARSLLVNADVYILDEALSEVDLEMEKKIINNIRNFFSKKTIIYVSHKNVKKCFKNIVDLKK